ncbi:MAG: PAS domain-containing protein [Proteobacteria bacterium]|nr:PAS domain-containing protein [Pseudomonadota bacterium]
MQSVINIALVGGETYCKEILEKTSLTNSESDVIERIVAVADPDHESPGMDLARQLGLVTTKDFHDLYNPKYNIDLIIVLTRDQEILDQILRSRPPHIRILSYNVFELFWKAIGREERKLRKRTEEMETILNGIQDFILVITPDREIVEVNEAFLTKMGFSREEVIGKKCHDVYQRTYRACNEGDLACPLTEVIRNKTECRQVRTAPALDSELRYFEVDIYPIWEKGAKISKFIHISRNITKRKKEEEEMTRRLEEMVEERTRQLKETHNKLLHQDKMASLGKLSASVVHEINNPIAGILNLTMLIKRILDEGPVGKEEMDQFRQYLNLMEAETRRTGRIVSNLLAFSRQPKIEMTILNLNRLVEQTLVLNSNLLRISRVTVETALDRNLPDIVGSADQIQQVFVNLISNAVEAMEGSGGGTLTVTTGHISREGKVLVSFEDTGKGIAKENLARIFEPFFTTKKEKKGVGLGLSVVYGIIEEHGGSIHVESGEGEGSIFTVKLPLKHPSDPQPGNGGVHEH